MTADAIGGMWTYVMELAQAFSADGIQVALAVMGGSLSQVRRAEADQVPGLELFEEPYKLEWMPDPWEDVDLAGDWLLELERQVQPDVIHLNGFSHGALPWRAPAMIASHSCFLSWWEAVKGEAAPAEWDEYRRRVAAGLHGVQMVTAPTRTMLGALHQHHGPLPEARVIYHGRNRNLFVPMVKSPLILTAGRLGDEAKNIQTLAKVAKDLPWRVAAAGNHSGAYGILTEEMEYLGQLTPELLAGWAARAAIFCLPALYEPFGLSILEAGLCECALVLSDIPSLRELWDGAALFVPPRDSEALRATLQHLIDSSSQQLLMGREARRRALRFSSSRMAKSHLEAYRELIAASSVVV